MSVRAHTSKVIKIELGGGYHQEDQKQFPEFFSAFGKNNEVGSYLFLHLEDRSVVIIYQDEEGMDVTVIRKQ